jgi:hypothetical protein
MMRDGRLTDASRRLGWAILDHVNKKTGDAWPNYERLGAVTGLSRATVGRGVQLLLKEGYFSHIQGGGNRMSQYPGKRKGLSNRYQPLFGKCRQISARLRPTKNGRSNDPAAQRPPDPTPFEPHETMLDWALENEGNGIPSGEMARAVGGPSDSDDDVF